MIRITRIITFIIALLLVAGCSGGSSSETTADPKITATAGSNGTISPAGIVNVDKGSDQSFTITADANYNVLDVVVDGVSMGPMPNYNFNNVTQDHQIEASFDKEHQLISMGNSITEGLGDDIAADDVSQDGKNSGGGFQPILNDLLTAYEGGFPHDIVNEGVGGDTSADGLAFIPMRKNISYNTERMMLGRGRLFLAARD
jgi:hypothetical protein